MRKHHQVREGQIVRVIDGPLTGFRGEVKEVDEQTAKVAVQVFGRVTPMDLALGADRIGARKFKLRRRGGGVAARGARASEGDNEAYPAQSEVVIRPWP